MLLHLKQLHRKAVTHVTVGTENTNFIGKSDHFKTERKRMDRETLLDKRAAFKYGHVLELFKENRLSNLLPRPWAHLIRSTSLFEKSSGEKFEDEKNRK